jgi:hypothetical protein
MIRASRRPTELAITIGECAQGGGICLRLAAKWIIVSFFRNVAAFR